MGTRGPSACVNLYVPLEPLSVCLAALIQVDITVIVCGPRAKAGYTVIIKFESKVDVCVLVCTGMTGSKEGSWKINGPVLTLQYALNLAAFLVRNKIGRTKRVYTSFLRFSVADVTSRWTCPISFVRGSPIWTHRTGHDCNISKQKICATSAARSCTWVMRVGVP